MFASFHNQSPLLTNVQHVCLKDGVITHDCSKVLLQLFCVAGNSLLNVYVTCLLFIVSGLHFLKSSDGVI